MIKTNKPNLSIEEIMERIESEVWKRKHQTASLAQTDKTEREAVGGQNNISLNIPTQQPFVHKSHYEFADFTKYHDAAFITNVYRGILKREPDVRGMQRYLHFLRNGERSKMEIISAIRYSKEGKAKNVNLLGSKKRYIVSVLYRLPVVGYISKTLVTLATLPKLLKRLNQYESYFVRHNNIIYDNTAIMQEAINKKVDIETLSTAMEAKADKEELGTLRADIEAKADIEAPKLI